MKKDLNQYLSKVMLKVYDKKLDLFDLTQFIENSDITYREKRRSTRLAIMILREEKPETILDAFHSTDLRSALDIIKKVK